MFVRSFNERALSSNDAAVEVSSRFILSMKSVYCEYFRRVLSLTETGKRKLFNRKQKTRSLQSDDETNTSCISTIILHEPMIKINNLDK